MHAYFSAQTPDQKPVKGVGIVRLLKIGYTRDGDTVKPFEKEVEHWPLNTNEEGKAYLQLKAAQAGQYRISYELNRRQ